MTTPSVRNGNHAKPTPTCYGCGAAVEDAQGNYYCEPCIAGQLREQGDEREAFDAYHRFADACARRSR